MPVQRKWMAVESRSRTRPDLARAAALPLALPPSRRIWAACRVVPLRLVVGFNLRSADVLLDDLGLLDDFLANPDLLLDHRPLLDHDLFLDHGHHYLVFSELR